MVTGGDAAAAALKCPLEIRKIGRQAKLQTRRRQQARLETAFWLLRLCRWNILRFVFAPDPEFSRFEKDHFVRNLGISLPGQVRRKPKPQNDIVAPIHADVKEPPVQMTLAQKLVTIARNDILISWAGNVLGLTLSVMNVCFRWLFAGSCASAAIAAH